MFANAFFSNVFFGRVLKKTPESLHTLPLVRHLAAPTDLHLQVPMVLPVPSALAG